MSYQRDYPKRLHVGVVGCGSHSYRNILPVLHYLPVRLDAVCDVNAAQAQRCGMEYGCRWYTDTKELYARENLDAVFLCVGPRLHSALAIDALDHGLHVWMEKPNAVSAAQVREVIAHRDDRICMVGLKKASMPAARKTKELAAELGGLEFLSAQYAMIIPDNGEEILANGETPNWLLNGVHPLSFLLFMGGPVQRICAMAGRYGTGAFFMEFISGITACLNMTPAIQPNRERYGAFGPGWQIEIENRRVTLDRGIPDFVYDKTWDFTSGGFDSGKRVWEPENCVATLENKALFTQGFYTETMEFCQCILEGRKPVSGTLEDSLEIMLVYEAGLRSHGNWVDIRHEEDHKE